jgi:TetR/AcrR family transcriptional regulator, regulator of cefoperazone and chloramphenicol sensitivity
LQIQRLSAQDGEIPRRLIDAASEEFARHGFAGTRVRDIVRAADVNLASVNYYFGGKEGLYAATLKELAVQRSGEYPSAPAAPKGEGTRDALQRHVMALLDRFVDRNGESTLGRILAHESMNPTPYFDLLVADILGPELERLRGMVLRMGAGKLDSEAASRCALSIVGQCLFYLFARGAVDRLFPRLVKEPASRQALAEHITAFSLAGVAAVGG